MNQLGGRRRKRGYKKISLKGAGFWGDVWKGLKIAGKTVADVAPYALPLIGLGHKRKKRSRKNIVFRL